MLVQAMVAMAISVVPVLAPVLGAHYGVAPSLIGIYSSLVFVGAIGFTLLGGLLVRRFGAVRCSQAALTIAGSALAATALSPLAGVIVFGVITGMGYGLATPGASHILARVTPAHRRGVVFSMKQSAVPLGGLLAGLIAPVAAAAFGWRGAMIGMAGLVVAVVLVIRPLRAPLDDDRDPAFPITLRSPFAAVANVLRDPKLRGLAIATFAYAAMQSSVFSIFTAYLVETAGLSLITAGQAFASLQTAGVVARVMFGWLSDKLVPARFLLAGIGIAMAVTGVLTAQLGASWPVSAVFALAALLGFAAAGWPGIYLADLFGRHGGIQLPRRRDRSGPVQHHHRGYGQLRAGFLRLFGFRGLGRRSALADRLSNHVRSHGVIRLVKSRMVARWILEAPQAGR